MINILLWQLLTKIVNNILSSLTSENLMEITRELDKKFPIYYFTIIL